MNIYFETGENYYPGFQKFNILADGTFRRGLLVFVPMTAMQIPAVALISPGMHREIFFILLFLVYMLPAAISLAGGMPARGWRWYAAAAVLYAGGTIPIALGASYYFLALIVPALFCLRNVSRAAPHVFEALGYRTPVKPAVETVFALLATTVLISYLWMAQALIRKSGVNLQSPEIYLWHAATSSLYYGTLWGIMYGVLMRRFLDMRYNIMLPITLNILIMCLYWIPSILGYKIQLEMAIGGSIFQSFASQVSLGLTFYFCRSTRPLLAAFVLHYLFVKTIAF